jgi:tetratricopeptide (TPR) repeat protein
VVLKFANFISSRRGLLGWLIPAVSILSVGIFLRFHSSTLLLGDGQLVLNNFEHAGAESGSAVTRDLRAILSGQPTAKGATLLYCLTARVSEGAFHGSPLGGMRALNCLLGGILVLVVMQVVLRASVPVELRIWLGFLVLSSGMMELFFGYIENYTPLIFFAALYTISSLVAFQRRRTAWLAVAFVCLSASVFVHVAGILLLPSFALLVGRILAEKYRPSAVRWLSPLLIALMLIGTLGLAMFTRLGQNLLPLRATEDVYGILTPTHWLDMLNELLLLVPAFPVLAAMALASLVLTKRSRKAGSVDPDSESRARWGGHVLRNEWHLALLLLVPCLLFLTVFKAEISMPRDWDLFAVTSIGLVPAALIIVDRFVVLMRPRSAALVAVPLWVMSVGLGIGWIGINADSDMATTRYEQILTYEKTRASYAYEILAAHYQREQKLPQAIEAMEKAVTFSASPRMYVYLESLYKADGRLADAVGILRKTVQEYPRHDGARNDLVLLLAMTDSYDELLSVAREGTVYHPDRPVYHYYYGRMLLREGRTEEGIAQLLECRRLHPGPDVVEEIDRVVEQLGAKDIR